MSYSFSAGEAFKVAIRIEENGRKFYEESQRNIESADVRTLFADLAIQEMEHKKKFETLLAQLPPESTASRVWDPENELDQYIRMMADDHVYITDDEAKDRIGRIRDSSDALKMAMEFEKDTLIFFLGLEEAMADKKDRELIKSLLDEEQGHLKRLASELRKISGKRS